MHLCKGVHKNILQVLVKVFWERYETDTFENYFTGWFMLRQFGLIKIVSYLYLMSVWMLSTTLYTAVDAHFGPSQESKTDLFTALHECC